MPTPAAATAPRAPGAARPDPLGPAAHAAPRHLDTVAESAQQLCREGRCRLSAACAPTVELVVPFRALRVGHATEIGRVEPYMYYLEGCKMHCMDG